MPQGACDPEPLPDFRTRMAPYGNRSATGTTGPDRSTCATSTATDHGKGQSASRQQVWLRADGTLPDDPVLHPWYHYASDMTLLDTTMPFGLWWDTPGLQMASFDHAMWFHRPFRLTTSCSTTSPQSRPARRGGRRRGAPFTRVGGLVVSVVQEGLARFTG